jgi:uncharacterized protein (TIGR00369 family)
MPQPSTEPHSSTSVNGAVRSRTYGWADPLETAARLAESSGLEALQALASGEIPPPPIAGTLGFRLAEVEAGRAAFEVTPAEFHYNPIGVVHGGLAATLLDSAMGCAVQTTLDAGVAYTTLELHTNFVAPITRETGPVRAEGAIVHRGRTIATAEGRVVAEESGKLLAHGTTTCFVVERD